MSAVAYSLLDHRAERMSTMRHALGLDALDHRCDEKAWSEIRGLKFQRHQISRPRVLALGVAHAVIPLPMDGGRPHDYQCEVFAVAGPHALVRWSDPFSGWVAVVPIALLAWGEVHPWWWTAEDGWKRRPEDHD